MGALMNHTVLPPGADDRDLLAALKAVLAGHEDVSISTPDGSVPLPDSVRGLLVDAVTAVPIRHSKLLAPSELSREYVPTS